MESTLEPPDRHHLSAALGWLGLGNWREAQLELDKISAQNRYAPAVLLTAYDVAAASKDWNQAADIADRMVNIMREAPGVWLSLAYAVRRKAGGGVEQARTILLKADKKFPGEAMIAYNLSCYECQLGNIDQARDWLDKAMARGDAKQMRDLALKDNDLEPLWKDLRAR
jgi:tetratricopeptide (TPR) repeat protein